MSSLVHAKYDSGTNSVQDPNSPVYGNLPQPWILAQLGTPRVLLPSGTFADTTGSMSALTALPYIPAGVVQVFVFAGAGIPSSELYYATFSSTTACQLYERVASNPAVPGTTKPSGITAGAYAGGTATSILATITVPGGTMGPNGRLRVSTFNSFTNPAGAGNNKVCSALLGAFLVASSTLTTSTAYRMFSEICNQNSVSVQTGSYFATPGGGMVSPTDWRRGTINTAVDQNLTLTAQCSIATDYCILENYCIEVLPS